VARHYGGHIMRHLVTEMFPEIIVDVINVEFPFVADGNHFGAVGGDGQIKHAIETPFVHYRTGKGPDNNFLIDTGRDEILAVGEPATYSYYLVVLHRSYTLSRLFVTRKCM